MFDFNEYRKECITKMAAEEILAFCPPIPVIECVDGLTLSVQASSTHYSSPRSYYGPHSQVEVGFPSERIPEIMEWVDCYIDEEDTFYKLKYFLLFTADAWLTNKVASAQIRMMSLGRLFQYWAWPQWVRLRFFRVVQCVQVPERQVYGYVPVEIVNQVVNDHGGIKREDDA